MKPLAIVNPFNLNWCVRLYEEIIPNANLYWNSIDELTNAEGLFGLWWIGYVCFGEPINGKLLSCGGGGEKVSPFEIGGEE